MLARRMGDPEAEEMTTSVFGFDTDRAWEYENGFHLTSPVTRIAKILGQYDVYRRIHSLPGEIVPRRGRTIISAIRAHAESEDKN